MKKKIVSCFILFSAVLFSVFFHGCEKEESETVELPEVSTTAVADITTNSARSGGTVSDDGGAPVTAKGVVWNTSPEPTVDNNVGKTTKGEGEGEFTCELTGLDPETTYYIRAYATNSLGTAYGQQLDFETSAIPKYTLTLEANPESGGDLDGAGDYVEDAEVPVSATASDGYEFTEWTVSGDWNIDDLTGEGNNSNSEITVTMPQGDVHLTANFEAVDFTLSVTVNNPEKGEVLDAEGVPFTEGKFNIDDEITLNAVAGECYRLADWSMEEGDGVISDYIVSGSETDNEIILKMGAGNLSVQANFETGFAVGEGTEGSPYEITTPEELAAVMCEPDSYFRLMNDINLDHSALSGEEWYDAAKGWMPVGDENTPFNGSFNGNGNTVFNLFIDRGEAEKVGLFGETGGNAVIENLVIENADVKGRYNTGGLVGSNAGGLISNCHFSGTVIVTESNAGGIAGWSMGIIEDCTSESVVSAPTSSDSHGMHVGSITGFNSGIIRNTFAEGEVIGTESVGGITGYNVKEIYNCSFDGYIEGGSYVGGLVGYNFPGADDTIERSTASGTVKGTYMVGGLVGYNFRGIKNSYSTSYIEYNHFGGGLSSYYGGLVGHQTSSGSIEYCYSVNEFLNMIGGNIGGLVGSNDDGDVISSYYNKETSGLDDTGNGEPRTTEEMMQLDNYLGWPFGTVWEIDEGNSYPYLIWQTE